MYDTLMPMHLRIPEDFSKSFSAGQGGAGAYIAMLLDNLECSKEKYEKCSSLAIRQDELLEDALKCNDVWYEAPLVTPLAGEQSTLVKLIAIATAYGTIEPAEPEYSGETIINRSVFTAGRLSVMYITKNKGASQIDLSYSRVMFKVSKAAAFSRATQDAFIM